jgi:cytochrome c peroxidase
MKYLAIIILVSFVFIYSCTDDNSVADRDQELKTLLNQYSTTGDAKWYIMPESDDYKNLPNQDIKNPITAAKAVLGEMLFFETGIGVSPKKTMSMETYSCGSCHIPEKTFTAGRFQGIADGALGFGSHGEGRAINPWYDGTEVDAQGARPLPMVNLAYVRNPLWNGSFGSFGMNVGTESLWGVADTLTKINKENREGLEAVIPRALVVHRQVINKELMDKLGYTNLFNKAFPAVPENERYTMRTASDAIAAYFRTILTNEAPFQKWLKGDNEAMTDNQKAGALLFFGKAKCVNCHNSPSLNGQRFAAIGVKNLDQMNYLVYKTNDGRANGRASFTLNDNDLYKFKVPQLYNLKDVGFYFHGSSKTSLKDVVKYFNNGLPENPLIPASKIDPFFGPLNLSDIEVDQLTDFLENGLYDANLLRYKPGFILSGNCFPNNDNQSKLDMGCN